MPLGIGDATGLLAQLILQSVADQDDGSQQVGPILGSAMVQPDPVPANQASLEHATLFGGAIKPDFRGSPPPASPLLDTLRRLLTPQAPPMDAQVIPGQPPPSMVGQYPSQIPFLPPPRQGDFPIAPPGMPAPPLPQQEPGVALAPLSATPPPVPSEWQLDTSYADRILRGADQMRRQRQFAANPIAAILEMIMGGLGGGGMEMAPAQAGPPAGMPDPQGVLEQAISAATKAYPEVDVEALRTFGQTSLSALPSLAGPSGNPALAAIVKGQGGPLGAALAAQMGAGQHDYQANLDHWRRAVSGLPQQIMEAAANQHAVQLRNEAAQYSKADQQAQETARRDAAYKTLFGEGPHPLAANLPPDLLATMATFAGVTKGGLPPEIAGAPPSPDKYGDIALAGRVIDEFHKAVNQHKSAQVAAKYTLGDEEVQRALLSMPQPTFDAIAGAMSKAGVNFEKAITESAPGLWGQLFGRGRIRASAIGGRAGMKDIDRKLPLDWRSIPKGSGPEFIPPTL